MGGAAGAAIGGSASAGDAGHGGVEATGDPLAPYPAPDCPGFMAFRAMGAGTCFSVLGKIQVVSPACMGTENVVAQTCAFFTFAAPPADPDAPVVLIKQLGALFTVNRGTIDPVTGRCSVECPPPKL